MLRPVSCLQKMLVSSPRKSEWREGVVLVRRSFVVQTLFRPSFHFQLVEGSLVALESFSFLDCIGIMELTLPSLVTHNPRTTRTRYIEGDITASERVAWESNFEAKPEALTAEEKDAFLAELSGVSLSSDAFFPFRDSIDHASKVAREKASLLFVLSRYIYVGTGVVV